MFRPIEPLQALCAQINALNAADGAQIFAELNAAGKSPATATNPADLPPLEPGESPAERDQKILAAYTELAALRYAPPPKFAATDYASAQAANAEAAELGERASARIEVLAKQLRDLGAADDLHSVQQAMRTEGARAAAYRLQLPSAPPSGLEEFSPFSERSMEQIWLQSARKTPSEQARYFANVRLAMDLFGQNEGYFHARGGLFRGTILDRASMGAEPVRSDLREFLREHADGRDATYGFDETMLRLLSSKLGEDEFKLAYAARAAEIRAERAQAADGADGAAGAVGDGGAGVGAAGAAGVAGELSDEQIEALNNLDMSRLKGETILKILKHAATNLPAGEGAAVDKMA